MSGIGSQLLGTGGTHHPELKWSHIAFYMEWGHFLKSAFYPFQNRDVIIA